MTGVQLKRKAELPSLMMPNGQAQQISGIICIIWIIIEGISERCLGKSETLKGKKAANDIKACKKLPSRQRLKSGTFYL